MGRIPERGKMINSGPILAYFTLDKNSQQYQKKTLEKPMMY